jgi:outer membrane murein-binding lipoprotein Lpp
MLCVGQARLLSLCSRGGVTIVGAWYKRSRLAALLAGAAMLTNTCPVVAQSPTPTPSADERIDELSHEVQDLKALVHQLQDQLSRMTSGAPAITAASAQPAAAAPTIAPAPTNTDASPQSAVTAAPTTAGSGKPSADLLRGTTINAMLDGYYEYNLNAPLGRANYLRAYDVSSNSFSLNQADLMVENAPTADRPYGMRLDLQFGQATSTLQGSPANELRPDVYRNVFQAYGTYVFPVANGLTVDFGKWASSLGMEGNYTKDQLNYSRSFWFDYLPFYHMGIRSKLAINDAIAVNVWITNGTNQTEAFNSYKDQLIGIVVTPTSAVSWTLNFYDGQEHPDVIYIQNPTTAQLSLPNEQGTYLQPIINPPTGRLEIADTYATWQVTKALYLAAEADYVQQRLYTYSSPARVQGGALYVGYQLSSQIAVAARAEYLADIGGLYSGITQYLKEGTLTIDYRPADGFLMRGEFRRDQSNQPYFLGHLLGDLETSQPTIGLGLVWWFGGKDGAW